MPDYESWRGLLNNFAMTFVVNSGNIAVFTNARWFINVHINGEIVKFKIDTGADVSIIPEPLCSKLNSKIVSTDRTFIK